MPTREELILMGKNQGVIKNNGSAKEKMSELKQNPVSDKPMVIKKDEMKNGISVPISLEKSPIIISLEQILASKNLDFIKKDKIKKYIKQICQNPHLSFKMTGNEIEKIDLFFTKPEICQLMTVRTRLSAYLSKTPQEHEGETIREIRSYLDNLRLIAFSKSDPFRRKNIDSTYVHSCL